MTIYVQAVDLVINFCFHHVPIYAKIKLFLYKKMFLNGLRTMCFCNSHELHQTFHLLPLADTLLRIRRSYTSADKTWQYIGQGE